MIANFSFVFLGGTIHETYTRMELEAEDGCVIFVGRGCRKELGRGLGISTQDQTVSRRQVLVVLPGPSMKVGSVEIGSGTGRLNVQVLGPNPVCIVRSGGQDTSSLERKTAPRELGLVFLKKGEQDWLSVGDKISLSIRHPFFFTVKEGSQRMKEGTSGFIERTGSTAGEPIKKETFSKEEQVEIGNQDGEDDLMASWKARKKSGQEADKQMFNREQCVKKEGTCFPKEDDEKLAAKEEEGIAEAVARRQKRASERRQREQQQQQAKFNESSREIREAQSCPERAVVNDRPYGIQEVEDSFTNAQQIDPVKEFGFLVEGLEFEQYGQRRRHDGGKWDWCVSKKLSEEGEEQSEGNVGHTARSKRNKKKDDDDEDEEWVGEDEEEKLRIAKAKAPKVFIKSSLRSHDPSSSLSKRASTESRGKHCRSMDDEESEEDEEDETLGGFIVDDDDDEEEQSDEEEEWCDDDEMDEKEDDSQASKVKQGKHGRQKGDQRPLCKYGKDCYRKNKEHLEQYRHS